MTETITTTVSDRICKHMNKDHGDALVLYAQFFGKLSEIQSARMLSIDHQAMYLAIDNDSEQTLKIEFDHQLENAQDAHHTLVEMMKEAKQSS